MKGDAAHAWATIELSLKVVDSEDRLRATLAHELCHAAAWLLNHERRPPHGPHFWSWAQRCSEKMVGGYLSAPVATCHNYVVHKPFHFQCTAINCGLLYQRFNKRGINPDKHLCGECMSPLEYLGKFNIDGTPHRARAPGGFTLYVKEHFASVRRELLGVAAQDRGGAVAVVSHGEVMRALSHRFKDQCHAATGGKEAC